MDGHYLNGFIFSELLCMKKIFTSLILFVLVYTQSFADVKSEIKRVNKQVSQIEKTIKNLDILALNVQTEATEASPPEIKYYYDPENLELALLRVSAGHEVFSTQYSYYYNNGKIIKFLKEIIGRPDSPPKQAIIYGKDESILWKNIDAPVISTKKVIEIFELNMKTLISFSKY